MKRCLLRYFIVFFVFIQSSIAQDFNFTKQDLLSFEKLLELASKRKTQEAFEKSEILKNDIIYKIMNWFYVKDPNSGADFRSITKFISNNPKWPEQITIATNAELSISSSKVPDTELLQWFKNREPITKVGMILLAEAKLRKNKEDKDALKLLKKSWIYGDFSKTQQMEFLSKYQNIITQGDYQARIENLLWQEKATEKNIISQMSPEYQKLYNVIISLQSNPKNINRLKEVPEKLKNNPCLIYNIALIYQKNKDYNQLTNILKKIKNPKDHQDKWWAMKSRQIRELLEEKQYQDAYDLAVDHNNIDVSDYADAHWMAGWISLRFLHNHNLASQHFGHIYEKVKYPISISRACYWLGKANEKINQQESIKFYKLAATHSETFYGQLAIRKLDLQKLTLPKAIKPTSQDLKNYLDNDFAKASFLFAKYGKFGYVKIFNKKAIESSKSAGEIMLINEMSNKFGNLHVLVETAKHAAKEKKFFTKFSYPVLGNILSTGVEKPLILSIIRQESVFDHQAQSSAGALGFMQLIPSTAKQASKALQLPFKQHALKSDKSYNIQLGTYSLKKLISYYDGSYILAIAAYNAGEGNVNKWIKKYGDPRNKDLDHVVDWVESIPFYETRNYLHRVLENLQIYRIVSVQENVNLKLSLDKDLTR